MRTAAEAVSRATLLAAALRLKMTQRVPFSSMHGGAVLADAGWHFTAFGAPPALRVSASFDSRSRKEKAEYRFYETAGGFMQYNIPFESIVIGCKGGDES